MRKALSLSGFVLIIPLLILFLGSLRVFAQSFVWKEEGVIFSDPTIHNVAVIPLPDGRYRMYFASPSGETSSAEGGASFATNVIKSAISSDGRSFQTEEGIRLEGSMPSIIKLSDGKWRMYFAKQIATEQSEGSTSPNAIYSAVSSDGLNWSVKKGIRLSPGGEFDPDNVVHPSVIALPQGGYRMYYDGEVTKTEQEFTWRILSATSPNGLTWAKDEGVRVDVGKSPLEADLVFNSHAKYNELTGTYELYFSVQRKIATEQSEDNTSALGSGIYLATSTDGLLFSDPIVQLTPKSESGQFQDPFVLEFPEGKRMYFAKQIATEQGEDSTTKPDGIYSALLTKEVNDSEPKSILETTKQKLAEIWGKVKEFKLPENLELYIIPTILLLGGAVAVIYLWRSRIRR